MGGGVLVFSTGVAELAERESGIGEGLPAPWVSAWEGSQCEKTAELRDQVLGPWGPRLGLKPAHSGPINFKRKSIFLLKAF